MSCLIVIKRDRLPLHMVIQASSLSTWSLWHFIWQPDNNTWTLAKETKSKGFMDAASHAQSTLLFPQWYAPAENHGSCVLHLGLATTTMIPCRRVLQRECWPVDLFTLPNSGNFSLFQIKNYSHLRNTTKQSVPHESTTPNLSYE